MLVSSGSDLSLSEELEYKCKCRLRNTDRTETNVGLLRNDDIRYKFS